MKKGKRQYGERWQSWLILMTACLFLLSCDRLENDGNVRKRRVAVTFPVAGLSTRSMSPDENIIKDLNLFVFNENGLLEVKEFVESGDLLKSGHVWHADLVENGSYSIYACANFGYPMDLSDEEEVKGYRFYMAYPDEYAGGMPMAGHISGVRIHGKEMEVPLERLMSRISVRMDRSRLDDDVKLEIRSIRVGGCPRSVPPFRRNHIRDPFDFFSPGFLKSGIETEPLNRYGTNGISGYVHLYQLENMQGNMLPGNQEESLKVPVCAGREDCLCSYIEICSEYQSGNRFTRPGEFLVYRIFPGRDPSNFDVERNCSYSITVMPQGDGLNGTGWRIDCSGLGDFIRSIDLIPHELNFTYIGEKKRLHATIAPENIGSDLLHWETDDRNVAEVYPDGTVEATGEGRCRIFCRATDGSSAADSCDVEVISSPYYMNVYPADYIECTEGDTVRVRCDFFPPDTPFSIGKKELDFDKSRGIYDYEIGKDGRSVTLYTKKRGSGILYMETGAPVNKVCMVVLIVK